MQHPSLTARQSSYWNAFRFDLMRGESVQGPHCGHIDHAWYAQPSNAVLRVHKPGSTKGQIQVLLDGRHFRVAHTYTKRAFLADIQYTLLEGADEATERSLATLDIHYVKNRRLPRLTLREYADPQSSSVGFNSSPVLISESDTERAFDSDPERSSELRIEGNFLKRRYRLIELGQGSEIGRVWEHPGVLIRRSFTVQGASVALPVKALIAAVLTFLRP